MAEAKKNPNGTWTILVYSHTVTKNGKPKRIYQRFTAEKKKDCEQMAKEFEVNRKQDKMPNDLTVSEAVEKYIELKSNILSLFLIIKGFIKRIIIIILLYSKKKLLHLK